MTDSKDIVDQIDYYKRLSEKACVLLEIWYNKQSYGDILVHDKSYRIVTQTAEFLELVWEGQS